MVFITDGFFDIAIKSLPEWDLNPQLLIPFRGSNRQSFPAMVLTLTQSEATPILSIAQCHTSFRLFGFASHHVYLIEVFCS